MSYVWLKSSWAKYDSWATYVTAYTKGKSYVANVCGIAATSSVANDIEFVETLVWAILQRKQKRWLILVGTPDSVRNI